ncbi:isopentenyl transferase family protein, partial [Escherichia coli]|uniref:isopentenyl transferase family protein n=2 Tax=Pseudomonadota TaxID=1224 RepID=UPI0024B1DA19
MTGLRADRNWRGLAIAGPTASGKSRLALDWASSHDGIIINADAMQVYSDLRVITARPGAADEAIVPHRLYGIVDGSQAGSAQIWAERACAEIAAARAQGAMPVLVGGTGLYFRALF